MLRIGKYSASPNSNSSGTSYSYKNVDEFISNTKLNIDYKQEVGCELIGSVKMQLSLGASYDYRKYTYNNTYIYEYNVTYKDYTVADIADDALLEYCLSENFVKDIKGLSNATAGMDNKQKAKYLFENYGTHAILGITTGGKYVGKYTVSTNDTDKALAVDASFKIGTGGGAIDQVIQKNFELGVTAEQKFNWKDETTETYFEYTTYGGSGGAATSPSDISNAIKSWSGSFSEDTANSVALTKKGAISLSYLIAFIDSAVAAEYENYINEKSDETYHEL